MQHQFKIQCQRHPGCFRWGLSLSGTLVGALAMVMPATAASRSEALVLDQFMQAQPQVTIAHQRQMLLAQRENITDQQFKALFDMANKLADRGDYVSAIRFYVEITTKLREYPYRPLLASSLWRLGSFYTETKEHELSLKALDEAATIAESVGDRELLQGINASRRITYNNLGAAQIVAQNYPRATQLFEQSLALARQSGTPGDVVLPLLKLAEIQRNQQQYRQALILLNQAQQAARGESPETQSVLLMVLGRTHDDLSEYPEALNYYNQAIALNQKIGDRDQVAAIGNNVGTIYMTQGKREEAKALFQQGLTHARAAQQRYSEPITPENIDRYCQQAKGQNTPLDRLLNSFCPKSPPKAVFAKMVNELRQTYRSMLLTFEGNTLNNLGQVESQLSNYSGALDYYRQAIAVQKLLDNTVLESSSWNNIGGVYASQGNYPAALENYEKSLALSRQNGNRNQLAATMSNVAQVYQAQGQNQKAIQQSEAALAILREIGDRHQEATLLNNLSTTYVALAQYDRAEQLVNQSLKIYRELGSQSGEATSLNNLAVVVGQAGRMDESIRLHEQSLKIAENLGDRDKQATVLGNLGRVYVDLAQYAKGLDYYNRSLAIQQAIGAKSAMLTTQGNLAGIYRTFGQPDRALVLYDTVIEQAAALGEPGTMGIALAGSANIFVQQGDFEEAEARVQKALTAHRAAGAKRSEIADLRILGDIQFRQNQNSAALASYQQAAQLAPAVGPLEESSVAQDLAEFYLDTAQYDLAQNAANQAIAKARPVKYQDIVAQALTVLGEARLRQNQSKNAIAPLQEAIGIWESLRPGLQDRDKVSLFDMQAMTYRNLQAAYVAAGQPQSALEIAERGRARSFVELFATKTGQANQARNSLNLTQIKALAQQQQTTLVEYSLINDRTLYVWVVKPTGEVIFREIQAPMAARSVAAMVQASRSTIGVRSRSAPKTAVADPLKLLNTVSQSSSLQQLHDTLIAPIAQDLPADPNQTVTFMPQGALFYVPFAALANARGQALIERHTIAIAPSIQSLSLTAQLKNRPTAQGANLIVGNPVMPAIGGLALSRLPGAEAEAKAVSGLLKTTPLIGDQATKTAVLRQISQARVVHLATHGLLDTFRGDVPGAVVLAASRSEADSLLTASEIADLKLQADLVVLSACSTGKGDITGDGVIGLSRSFFLAGVPTVVVSLWDVDDAATSSLMTAFYRNWQTGAMNKAQALRQAMLETRKSHPNPNLWAAFNLLGETR